MLRDLSIRIPYSLKVSVNNCTETLAGIYKDVNGKYMAVTENANNEHSYLPVEHVKPFLRTMSSMTTEESVEYLNTFDFDDFDDFSVHRLISKTEPIKPANNENIKILGNPTAQSLIWLNQHHFDYMGLIDKNLAIDVATEKNTE